MFWVRRTVGPAEWDEVQDQFESLFVKLGCPGQMMLVAVSHVPDEAILFASLPNSVYLGSLPGFESIGDSALPSEASLLVGHAHQFGRHFRYPARKAGD
jgi:hypothetical protein